jgi:hypothetical protein
MNMPIQLTKIAFACAIVWLAAGTARAGIESSVDIGNVSPVKDALARNLPGTWLGDSNLAARVEIREVGTGILNPYEHTAEAIDLANPLFRLTHLGENVLGANPGMFSEKVADRQDLGGKSYYARVYDHQLPSASLYYADSLPFQDVPSAQWPVVHAIEVVFQEDVRLVSGAADLDSDNDGIKDAFEQDGGEFEALDENDPDTDDDGYGDRFEVDHAQYLNPTDIDSNEIVLYSPEAAGEHMATWWAIPGVGYRLEYTDALLVPEAFTEIWSGTAAQTNMEVIVEDWVTNSVKGFFRWTIP